MARLSPFTDRDMKIAPSLHPGAEALARLAAVAQQTVTRMPALKDFLNWPDALPLAQIAPGAIPATDQVAAWQEDSASANAALQGAIRDFAPFAHWQCFYDEADVGSDFLARYGVFELAGPQGHCRADTFRVFIAYWGAGLNYGWHLHEAEELYFIVAGTAEFHARDQPTRILQAGDWRNHASLEPHAMITHADPVLTMVLWRGNGLSNPPRMMTD